MLTRLIVSSNTKGRRYTYIKVLLVLEPVVDLGDAVVGLVGDKLVLAVEFVQLLSYIVTPTLDARPLAQARVQAGVNLF